MKVVLQRVKKASVVVGNDVVGRIDRGLCLLVGVERGDREEDAHYLAKKIAELRIFPDEDGKMNLSVGDTSGGILVISQFTLAGSVRKGRRPSFDRAERPERAEELFNTFVDCLRGYGNPVETGLFAAMMDVEIVNDGPVTFVLESHKSP
ncbi:MAG: D-aminoacyl-tRNA deacylase [Candidatus Aminicenantes bacterium]|jgi:D-tyrosyl-tRNA(Tyr) deacylase